MKLFKYSLLGYVLLVIFFVSNVVAGNNPPAWGYIGVHADVSGNNPVSMAVYTKGNDFNVQSYNFQNASAPFNSNCTSCNFRISLYRKPSTPNTNDILVNYKVGHTGDSKYLDSKYNQTSSAAGDYYLQIKREDWTLLSSTHTGDWYIAASNPNASY